MSQERKELLIGCGHDRHKWLFEEEHAEWSGLVTLDIVPPCDVRHNLNVFPYPFDDNEFDEIHAYNILEHTGKQGDVKFFFDQFEEFYRILKPNGKFYAIVPHYQSIWAWGDPGHTRIINAGTLVFLSESEQKKQKNMSPMTDYSELRKCNFDIFLSTLKEDLYLFALEAK